MHKYFCIAGHCIRIEGNELACAVDRIDGFAPFATEACESVLAVFTLATQEAPEMSEVLYTTRTDDVDNCFGRYNNGYLFYMQQGALRLQMWCDTESTTVCFSGDLTERLARFALWVAYGLVTIPHDTIAIHTSVIQYHNRAVLFLGESGTGKSTHTRLWRESIPGASLLNDDSPIVRIIDGEPWVFGSPWSGKTPCYKNEQYPLAGCVRLSQAPYNRIERLSTLKAFGAIHPSCPPDFAYDVRLYDYICHTISQVLEKVPVYHLACLPDVEAAQLSCRTIFA